MGQILIDAVGVTSRNMAASVAFYRLLGFEFPEFATDAEHVEALTAPGRTRLMIDSHDLATRLGGKEPVPASHSQFALLCPSPREVDRIVARVSEAGLKVVKAPWDAFWGQRYAIVADPDGYRIDLFAPL